MGKDGQAVPEMNEEWIATISNRYIELYEKVIGEKFVPTSLTDEEIYAGVISALEKL